MVCYRCHKINTIENVRPSNKIKSLSKESSKNLKRCSACDCRVFLIN